jgi:hypothetical protein
MPSSQTFHYDVKLLSPNYANHRRTRNQSKLESFRSEIFIRFENAQKSFGVCNNNTQTSFNQKVGISEKVYS